MDKVYASAAEALAGIVEDGQMIAVGGFGLCGIPEALIAALRDSGVKNLTCISNNAGVDGFGLGQLLNTRQIRKMIASASLAAATALGLSTIVGRSTPQLIGERSSVLTSRSEEHRVGKERVSSCRSRWWPDH